MTYTGPFSGIPLRSIAGQLRDGSTDPVRLTEQALAAIYASQPALNAFVTINDRAVDAAIVARDERAAGLDRGPLHGIPVAVKDIVDTAGLTTTMGSRHFAQHIPTTDAEVVTRLREAGAIIVGKTTTHEFAYGPTGDRTANGPAANPHDPTRMTGGSSAGSAGAVAAGLVPLAVGTDTGGSVRIPAALCGVWGIRPTSGRIPTDGVFPLSWALDSVGPIASDLDGLTVGWRVLADADPDSDTDVEAPSVEGLRVGRPGAWFERLDPAVRDAVDALVGRLADHGAQIVDRPLADAEELLELYRTIQSVDVVAIHHERLATAPELFDPEVLQRLRAATEVPAYAYARAVRRLAEVRTRAAERFADVDLYLSATVPILAPPVGARDLDLGGGWTSPRDALLAHTAPWSSLGVPSMSLPLPTPGLPVGVQLIAPPGADEWLLSVARAVASEIPMTGQIPADQRESDRSRGSWAGRTSEPPR